MTQRSRSSLHVAHRHIARPTGPSSWRDPDGSTTSAALHYVEARLRGTLPPGPGSIAQREHG